MKISDFIQQTMAYTLAIYISLLLKAGEKNALTTRAHHQLVSQQSLNVTMEPSEDMVICGLRHLRSLMCVK